MQRVCYCGLIWNSSLRASIHLFKLQSPALLTHSWEIKVLCCILAGCLSAWAMLRSASTPRMRRLLLETAARHSPDLWRGDPWPSEPPAPGSDSWGRRHLKRSLRDE